VTTADHATALDPRFYPYRADIAADWLAGHVHAARFVPGQMTQVRVGCTALRRSADGRASRDSDLLWGEVFIVYDRQGDWSWGQNQTDGYVGYVPSSALMPLQEPGLASHEVCALRTPLLPQADLKSAAMDYLHLSSRVQVIERQGDYLEIAAGGWLYAPHLVPLTAIVSDHVATARRFMETPYLWGGRSSFGLDCSALVQLSLARAGRAVARDSDIQAKSIGTPVDEGVVAASVGDLLFCDGHVGLLSAPGMLLHANAYHMAVAEEPLPQFIDRIAARGLEITAVRRPQ
jgi:hypothetical protein